MPERELSPYSARVALTQKLRHGQGNQTTPAEHKNRPSDTRGQPERGQNGRSRSPAPHRGRRGEKELDRSPAPTNVRTRSPVDRPRETKSKDLSVEPTSAVADRDASPEPYRRPREASSKDRKDRRRERDHSRGQDRPRERPRSRDRDRDGSRDRERTKKRHHSRDRNRSKERNRKDRDRSRDRHREKRRERSDERRRDGSRERRRSRDRDKKLDCSRDRHRHRSRSRDRDRSRDRHGRRDRDHRTPSSPPPKRRRRRTPSPSRSPSPHRRSKAPLPTQEQALSIRGTSNSTLPPTKYGGAPPTLEKPNFQPTGLLAKAANKVEGTKISLKYHEPAEARKPPPSQPWRIFVFKGEDVVDTIMLGGRSCWLFGRSAEVVDYVLEHPSASGQHAVVQFRYIQKTSEDEFGAKRVSGRVRPYVIDLESSNGTELNGEEIETGRYVELRNKDMLRFAGSEREYVVMLPPKEEVEN